MEEKALQDKELEMIVKYRDAKKALEAISLQADEAGKEVDRLEYELIELLRDAGKESSARYKGIGWVTMPKPRLYASCKEENRQVLFEWLRTIGREDLVKEQVSPGSLSTFIKERIEGGEEVPEFVSFHLKPSLKFYSAE